MQCWQSSKFEKIAGFNQPGCYSSHVKRGRSPTQMEHLKHAYFMHSSAHFMLLKPESFMHEISCNSIEQFAIPCMIPETCMQHPEIWNVFQIGTCMLHAWSNVHISCIFHACTFHARNVNVSCMKWACSIHGILHVLCMKHAYFVPIPCVESACSMCGTCI